ncbi:MAG TPA: thiosulfate oxidation carrier protein SoxY [Gammaproteobacteria bacterium]|jgi:sulfur-oxidizing protein SoxY|nr:thiosulfate oxidation carrier protein SoxY [Gammaproteobacteria bacterium]
MRTRRFVLKTLSVGALTAMMSSLGLFRSRRTFAERPDAFAADSSAQTIAALAGDTVPLRSDRIRIEIPVLAEDGAVVPVKIHTDLAEVESISLIAEKNPMPLVASFKLATGVVNPFIATRIKLAQSSYVIALVKAQGRFYIASKSVKVIESGCG